MSLFTIFQNLRISIAKTSLRRTSCAAFFSMKAPHQGIVKEIDPNTGEVKTKKTSIIPKITLISGDSVSVTTIQEAEKLSKRRDLKLVKIVDTDTKTQRPVYRLMTGAEYHAEDLKQRENRKQERQQVLKGEKMLLINSKIAEHDLETQLRKAVKWIRRMYEVRVIISGSDGALGNSEKVYSTIEQYFKNEESDAKFCQKKSRGSDIKFQITPPRNKDESNHL